MRMCRGFSRPARWSSAWEQRKLGELGSFHRGKRFTAGDFVDEGGIPCIHYGEIYTHYGATTNETASRVRADMAGDLGYAEPGDLVIATTSENVEDVCKAVAWLGKCQVAIHDDSYAFKHGCDPAFLSYFFSSEAFRAQKASVAYGVKVMRVNDRSLSGVGTPTPSLPEQSRIGALFDSLDSLITLHQRECDQLKTFKKSLLEKMFPREGESVPEIRFAGFTDPWEQRKLGELVRRVTRKNEELESRRPLTISAQHGLIDQTEYFNNRVAAQDLSGYYLIRRGEFAYNKSTSSDSPWGAVKRLERYEKGCVSTLYIVFEPLNVDPSFLATYYETNRWHAGVQTVAAEGARNHGLLNVAPDDFFETSLFVPSGAAEQRRIGALFSSLDSLITLHQRELELLKNIKKSMLEKMFV